MIESVGAMLLIGSLTYGADLVIFSFLDWHLIKVAGQTSYSYYLLQPIILFPITALVFPGLQAVLGYHYSIVCGLLLWIASTVVTMPLAWVSYRFLERPMIALSKSIVPHAEIKPSISGSPLETSVFHN